MATKVFKTDATYQGSVTFYDNYQRKTGYLATPLAKIKTPDRLYTFTSFISGINWTLSNAAAATEIPDTAYYYSVNITRCLRTRFFVQLRGRDATYVLKDPDGNYTFNTPNYGITNAGAAFDISTLVPLNMGYIFSEGDIVKIYIGANVYSLAIIGQQGNWIITELKDMGTLTAATPFLFEIYTPYKPSDLEPAYETGQIFKINNPGTPGRTYSNLAGVIQGDVWLLDRPDQNHYYYQIQPGSISVGQHTVGVHFISSDAADANILTGNSPLQSLAGFDPVTNNDRWIRKNLALPVTGKVYGKLKVSIAHTIPGPGATPFRLYLGDNNSDYFELVNEATVVVPTVIEKTFDLDFTTIANTRLFIFAALDEGYTCTYDLTDLIISVPSTTLTYKVEAMSPNDKFYKNWFTDAGRPNFIDTIGQVVNGSDVRWSNTYIAGSKVNGLSTYDALDVKSLPQECGPIQKLQLTSKVVDQGTVMLAICLHETASMYLGEVQLVGATTNSDLATANNVIGTVNVLKGSFGTRNPESVQEFKGNVFWLDMNNGKVIQYGINGLFPISNYEVTKFWKLFSEAFMAASRQQIEDWGGRPFVFFGIDPHNGELLASVPRTLADPPKGYLPDYPNVPYPFDIWDGRAKSVVYKMYKEPNYWQGAYDIPAENFIYAGNQLFAFKDGQLYQLNSETSQGNFFGVQYQSALMFAENSLPSKPKVANNIALQASKIPALCYFRTEFPYIQASDLKDFDPWSTPEGVFYCYIYNDKLTPSPTGLMPNALLLGDKIRGTVILVMLQWDAPVTFRFVNIGFSPSLGHSM